MVSNLLLGGLGILAVIFAVYFVRDILAHRGELEKGTNGLLSALIGFGINFLDTLGIGSFALGLALYKSLHQVDDRKIPGTLNVSCVPPVIAEACFFISAVQVEPLTLAAMLVSATLGAWIGAGAVSKLSKQKVQPFMGIALVVIGVVIVCQTVGLVPGKGEAIGLHGVKLIIAVVINFFLGAIMTLGVGLYAPCFALVSLLGMDPKVAFPIMMGSCAYLMPVASIRFIKEGMYNRKMSLFAVIPSVIGVFIASRLVLGLSHEVLSIVIVIVMAYSALSMFYSLYKEKKAGETEAEGGEKKV